MALGWLLALSACAERAAVNRPLASEVGAHVVPASSDDGLLDPAAPSAEDGVAHQDDDPGEEPEVVGDEPDDDATPRAAELDAAVRSHPLDGWDEPRLRAAVRDDLASLGSMSLGQPSAGALLNGVSAESSELFQLVDANHAYGTRETIDFLSAAVRKVQAEFPATAPLSLGHISAARGGPLRPHISHQSGRDVDISFYYEPAGRWYARATEKNLDLPRTWAFVRALVTETDVEMILIDQGVQEWIRRYALAQKEDADWVDGLFRGRGSQRAIVRHAPGHATHIHVRFFNPLAQETARRARGALMAEHIVPEIVSMVRYRTKRGDTLAKIAKRFSVSVPAIKEANNLRNSKIREQREYRIPLRAREAPPPTARLKFPPRRLPPKPAISG